VVGLGFVGFPAGVGLVPPVVPGALVAGLPAFGLGRGATGLIGWTGFTEVFLWAWALPVIFFFAWFTGLVNFPEGFPGLAFGGFPMLWKSATYFFLLAAAWFARICFDFTAASRFFWASCEPLFGPVWRFFL